MIFAILCASVSVASACTAAPSDLVHFTLESRSNDEIRASFQDDERDRDNPNWSASFAPAQLAGLDVAGFRANGTRPLRFALVREAGRLDCSGQGGNSHARGNCSLTADPAFAQLLESRGISRPTRKESFGLVALNVRRELVDAIASARYPTPDIDELMALTAVGVTRSYIDELARLGYRPSSIDDLVEFRALNITPEYIGAFARAGYDNMEPDDLVQLKALNVTPEYIAAFERMGYRNLPVDKLVQLKALDISPEFVRSVETRPGEVPPVDDLVERKILGRRR
jgi:hypothetical protein